MSWEVRAGDQGKTDGGVLATQGRPLERRSFLLPLYLEVSERFLQPLWSFERAGACWLCILIWCLLCWAGWVGEKEVPV